MTCILFNLILCSPYHHASLDCQILCFMHYYTRMAVWFRSCSLISGILIRIIFTLYHSAFTIWLRWFLYSQYLIYPVTWSVYTLHFGNSYSCVISFLFLPTFSISFWWVVFFYCHGFYFWLLLLWLLLWNSSRFDINVSPLFRLHSNKCMINSLGCNQCSWTCLAILDFFVYQFFHRISLYI